MGGHPDQIWQIDRRRIAHTYVDVERAIEALLYKKT